MPLTCNDAQVRDLGLEHGTHHRSTPGRRLPACVCAGQGLLPHSITSRKSGQLSPGFFRTHADHLPTFRTHHQETMDSPGLRPDDSHEPVEASVGCKPGAGVQGIKDSVRAARDVASLLLLDSVLHVLLVCGVGAIGPRHQLYEGLMVLNQRLVEYGGLGIDSEYREKLPLKTEDALTPDVLVVPGQQREKLLKVGSEPTNFKITEPTSDEVFEPGDDDLSGHCTVPRTVRGG